MALCECNTTVDEKGMELVEHGTIWFPVACYQDDFQKNDVPWHWHEELEVGIVIEGSIIVATPTSKYVLQKGDGFFINSGVPHGAWIGNRDGGVPCRTHSIVFHSRIVGGSLDSIFWQNYLAPLTTENAWRDLHLNKRVDWNQQILEAIEQAWKTCVDEQVGYEFEVRNALSRIVLLLNNHLEERSTILSTKEKRLHERMKQMLQYIEKNYSEDMTVRDIAQSASISISEAMRCFKKSIGKTPGQYMKHLRIHKASHLLLTTKWSISDIGYACGFREMSYFAKIFREEKGCTPSEYRKISD